MKFANFLRTPFLTEHLHWLLLYHCKIDLYRLRILLSIPIDCNIILSLFQLNFFFFLLVYICLQSFSKPFFFMPNKMIRLRLPDKFQTFSLYLYLYLQLFTLPYLHLIACTYLHLRIYTNVLVILLYELDKIVKLWKTHTRSCGTCSVRKVFLEILQNSQENTCARVSFLIKLQAIKIETLAQMLSCKLSGIFKNTFFYRTPLDDCFSNVETLTKCSRMESIARIEDNYSFTLQ